MKEDYAVKNFVMLFDPIFSAVIAAVKYGKNSLINLEL